MGINISIDNGTTYTKIAYNSAVAGIDEKNIVRRAIFPTGACSIPSAVSRIDDDLQFGFDALNGGNGVVVYRGFKLLLNEDDPVILEKHGYTDKFTPKYITREYLKYVMKLFTDSCNPQEEHIDSIKICMPLIWGQNDDTRPEDVVLTDTISSLLRDAVDELGAEYSGIYDASTDVSIINEPAAAMAMLIDNYKANTGTNYEGTILITDIGGGTFDALLANVYSKDNMSMFEPVKKWGLGLHSQDNLGQAGFAYINDVLINSIKSATSIADVPKNRDYWEAFNSLESKITTSSKSLSEKLSKLCIKFNHKTWKFRKTADIDKEEEKFCFNNKNDNFVYYDGRKIPVRAQQLFESFGRIIKPEYDKYLNEAKTYIEKNDITPLIAVIGGFGNFYLTRWYILKFFGIEMTDSENSMLEYNYHRTANDNTLLNSISHTYAGEYNEVSSIWRTHAVSLGAALVGNGYITYRDFAPFGVGLEAVLNGETKYFYCFTNQQVIQKDIPHFVKNSAGKEIPFIFDGNADYKIVLDYGEGIKPYSAYPHKSYRKFFLTPGKNSITYYFGAAIGRNNMVTLYLKDTEGNTRTRSFQSGREIFSVDGAPLALDPNTKE